MPKLDPASAELSASWSKLNLVEQMANIGSEVIRAINWQPKNLGYATLASNRALELLDLTKQSAPSSSLKEICRARELWLDYFIGPNQYHQTAKLWQKYFTSFNLAARINR